MDNLDDIIREVFSVDPASLSDETAFTDLENWDSLTHMMFITQVESGLSVELTGDEIAEMATIGDLKRIVGNHVAL